MRFGDQQTVPDFREPRYRVAFGVTCENKKHLNMMGRHLLAAMVAFASIFTATYLAPPKAANDDRSLDLYFVQTKERRQITFRRNGRYVQSGLNELNQFFRDWRRNEPTNMDPALFDLLWKVYKDVGATEPITVVSGYRSPQTNEMLRSRSRGVAKNSQHTKGSAIDFYIKGIPVSRLREAAMRLQVGGVGYYPNSRSPFVHLDTANVRAWPRMTRAQLQKLFPDGRTLHIPSNGVPLSAEGRRYAQAQWDKCRSVPCQGSASIIAPTGAGSGNGAGSGRTLFDLFFGTGRETEQAPTAIAQNTPSRRTVTTVPVNPPAANAPHPAVIAPTPAPRADFLNYRNPQTAPTPMPRQLLVATRNSLNEPGNLQDAPPASAPVPPRPIIAPEPQTPPKPDSALTGQTALVAYAPLIEPEPDAQRALQMLIERRSENASVQNAAAISPILRGSISTASLGPAISLRPPVRQTGPATDDFQGFFDNTFNAVANSRPGAGQQNNIALAFLQNTEEQNNGPVPQPVPQRPLQDDSIPRRDVSLYAPDLEHVTDTLVMQTRIANADFTILFEPDEADFDPAPELGPQAVQINFSLSQAQGLPPNRFLATGPVIISKS